MMNISPVAGAPLLSQTTASSDASKASLDYNSFLKLLMAQLKSQDPTDPVDQSQTLAQLASFSNVEQTIKLNDKLNMLIQNSGASEAVQLIGRHIESLSSVASGIVKSIEMTKDGMTAILQDNSRLSLQEGIRVS